MVNTRRIMTIGALVTVMALAVISYGALAAPEPGKPALIVSAGQSTDGLILKQVLTNRVTRETIPYNQMAEAKDVAGIKTLIVAVGVSNKGLGAAGIDIDKEMARVRSVLSEAKRNDCYIILVHIGGAARRGGSSDQMSRLVAPYAHQIIILSDSDEDAFFAKLGAEGKIAITSVEGRTQVGPEIYKLLGED